MPNPTLEDDIEYLRSFVMLNSSYQLALERLDRLAKAIGDKCECCHGHGVLLDAFYMGEPPSCLSCDGVGFVTAKRRLAIAQTTHLEHMVAMALRLGEMADPKVERRHRERAYVAMFGRPVPGTAGWVFIENDNPDGFESVLRVAQAFANLEAALAPPKRAQKGGG